MNNFILDPEKYIGFSNKTITEYDYIEIGTCDWDTFSLTKPELKGIIIEPIKIYLDNIPNNNNVIKVNCAISDKNGTDYMYYIPPDIINNNNIVNCFRGMNKLGTYHLGALSNNLTDYVIKEKCEVNTYFSLIKKYNITYIDFLKIDTEGNDCKIINNILDELEYNKNYILPRYILFENNGLTPENERIETQYRLYKNGYVHIFTKDDNTFMYNCLTHIKKKLFENNIILNMNSKINIMSSNFFQNVHSYIEYGQKYLFSNILNLDIKDEYEKSTNIWTTQEYNDYKNYNLEDKNIINIIHGGGKNKIDCIIKNIDKPNIITKSMDEYIYLKSNNINVCFFIGKYKSIEKLIDNIFEYRLYNIQTIYQKQNFLILHGFFNCNNNSILNTYNNLKNMYNIDLYGYDSPNGFIDVFNNSDNHILTKYKFYFHLKGLGYLCNSVIFACMCGIPIIMSRDHYKKSLYYQFIPEDFIIFYENYDTNKTNQDEIIPVLNELANMSIDKYYDLSHKLYLHGRYFREYYDFEINHLFNFINNLNTNKLLENLE